jgi:hypothetical protein
MSIIKKKNMLASYGTKCKMSEMQKVSEVFESNLDYHQREVNKIIFKRTLF